MSQQPAVSNVKQHKGIAGQYSISAEVQYDDEPAQTVTFVGSSYGDVIVMVTPGNPRGVFVSSGVTDRIGSTLTPEWVANFFA